MGKNLNFYEVELTFCKDVEEDKFFNTASNQSGWVYRVLSSVHTTSVAVHSTMTNKGQRSYDEHSQNVVVVAML